MDDVSRLTLRPQTVPRVWSEKVAESAVGTPLSTAKSIETFTGQVPERDPVEYCTVPTLVCVSAECELSMVSPWMFVESTMVTAIVGFEVNVHTFE